MAETMHLLKVDEHFAAEMARLIAYAKDPEHYWRRGTGPAPRRVPGHVTMLGDYEVTYAFTACALRDGKADDLPPISVLEFFARQLGFRSPLEKWEIGVVPESRMICAGEHLAG